MKLAVCLYKYFPYSGLARDFIRIMEATLTEKESADVFVMEWQGAIPKNLNVTIITVKSLTNHGRMLHYQKQVKRLLNDKKYDLIIGFNKMPYLDLYYAADPCYLDRIIKSPWYFLLKFIPRVKALSRSEKAVFGTDVDTTALMISDVQERLFKEHYHTPDGRLISLPPGIALDRKRPEENAEFIHTKLRADLGVLEDEWLVLMVGTAFHTKGVDRSISAIAELDKKVREKTHLFIVGEGNALPLESMAKKLGIQKNIHFMGGRTNIPDFLLAADILIHPARKENTGTVILEAMVAGLPVLVSDVCGYAKHVVKAKAGLLLTQPDDPIKTAEDLMIMLDRGNLNRWKEQALNYAANEDLYSMPQKVASIIHEQINLKQQGISS